MRRPALSSLQHESVPGVPRFVLARLLLTFFYLDYVLTYLCFLDVVQTSAGAG